VINNKIKNDRKAAFETKEEISKVGNKMGNMQERYKNNEKLYQNRKEKKQEKWYGK
jgi:hypothetical protein